MKKKNNFKVLLCLFMAMMMLLSACAGGEESKNSGTVASTNAAKDSDAGVQAGGSGKMTDVGTPRSETLIVDILSGRTADPGLVNCYLPGCVPMDAGFHQLVYANLWEIDTQKGEQICDLAATFPEASDSTNTKFTFKVREGMAWSDGVEFTADDVVFTSDMILKNKSLPYSANYASIVKSMKAIDKYTVEVETPQPETRLAQKLGVVVWGNAFKVVPKHIWEKEDPNTFKFTDPVSIGPYTLKDRDPQGYWFLFEKRKDWQKSDVGIISGQEPGPQYILFKFFGAEEKRIMAAVQHDIDVLQDITPESWDILRKKNSTAQAWYQNFPYATMDDPCERGIEVNTSKEPYNDPNVRWALTLLTDIKSVSMATFGGMLRVSPLQVPPITVLQDTYHKPMTEWLKGFALEDGYKPFDESYAEEMVGMLTEQGIEGLPTDKQAMKDTFGVGWWKYDPAEATKLLQKAGLKKEGDKWLLKNGKPWQITINAPANFEIESMRLAFAVADSWKKFGLDVNVQQMEAASFWDAEGTGAFELGSYWPACGLLPDVTTNLQSWHKKYVVPSGERASANPARWSNDTASGILDELAGLKSDDPSVQGKITDILKEFVKGQPFIPMFGTSKFVPVDTYYWTGYPTSGDNYEGPWWWWSQFKFYTSHLKPTGK